MPSVNIWAVIVAAVASQVLGYVWYSLAFGRPWALGYRLEATALATTPPLAYVGTILGALLYSVALAVAAGLTGVAGAGAGALMGVLVWAGLVAPRYLLHALFGRLGAASVVIDLGFDLLVSVVTGAVIGGWLPA